MPKKSTWAALIIVALCIYASQTYARHQAYKTGIYMGKTFFSTADFQNRQCLRADSSCEVTDLNSDSVMENALASAKIIPSFSESEVRAIHTGFRDGWREARSAALANR
jgi:hypothetical protein